MFDVSFSDIFTTFLAGASLYVTKRSFAIEEILELFDKHAIDICHFTPSQFGIMREAKKEWDAFKVLHFSGEALDINLLAGLNKNLRCVNYYGPTEGGEVTFDTCTTPSSYPLIGRPLNNVKLFILDMNSSPLPIGAVGELYIGGVCLARGYLNQPELTVERFISCCHFRHPGESRNLDSAVKPRDDVRNRLYKTGDLVRWLPDGIIEYIGRSDFQVKIRGFRIELGEIEQQLLKYVGIKQAVVLVHENNDHKILVAYYVADVALDHAILTNYLQSRLPEYMVPNILIYMSALPINENGKLNRKALPIPKLLDQSDYVAPKSELEQKTCAIYAEALDLPTEKVGITNDFFKMGGDSISSIQIVSKIRQQLGINIKVQEVFKYRNVEQLVANILKNLSLRASISERGNPENPETNDSVYLANNLQQGFIYHAISQGKVDSSYLSQFTWEYKVSIDENKFKQAWQLAQKKHPSLRLRFAWDKELVQIIDREQELDFRYVVRADTWGCPYDKGMATSTGRGAPVCAPDNDRITTILNQDRQKHYDLRTGNLFRIYLIKRSASNYVLILSMHHIILDGWSVSLLLDDVHAIYSQLLEHKQPQIVEDLTYQRAQKYLQEHQDENQEYWYDYLKQIEDRGDLKILLKPEASNTDIKNHRQVAQEQVQDVAISGPTFVKLKETCQINAITINAVIQYAWHKILHLYGASNTTVVGTVVSGRNMPINNIETAVGLFINTLPLIFAHNSESPVIEQIKGMQNAINEVNSRSNINLANLQPNGERLFDSLLVFENQPALKSTATLQCESTGEFGRIDYPLAVLVYEKKQVLIIKLCYDGELFSQETIAGVLNRMLFFMQQIAENPQIKTLNYLTTEEYQRIVIDYNQTERDYPKNKTVHQLFEEQVLKTPSNIAVVYENFKLTYQELNNRANQLAHYLLDNYSIKPDDLIVLCLNRSEYMIVAVLAVLKAGGAYVPIDPNYPDDRIKYILNDVNPKAILTNDRHKNRLRRIIDTKTNLDVIAIDSNKVLNELRKQKSINPITVIASNNLIYIIYTSGTTGNPKGVMIEHKKLINLISYSILFIKTGDIGVSYINYAFDAINVEIYPILLNGGSLHILGDSVRINLDYLYKYLIKHNVTFVVLPSILATEFALNYVLENTKLKTIIVGGDVYYGPLTIGNIKVVNQYGPTETTVCATLHQYNGNDTRTIIGKPIANAKCYIVNSNLNLLPFSVIGELVIGGEVLARGYHNQPDLTAEKFIPNPFQTAEEKVQNKNSRVYKTGDLVRMLPDGNIEYIGRNDFQVKIRGFRIELSEIENKLLSYPEIKQAAVLVKENMGDKYIVAYYVADQKIDEIKIYNYLMAQLPEYMLPSMLIYLHKLPLTSNGKLDRSSLPESKFEIDKKYVPPKNEREQLICDAFAKTLNIEKVGVNDDFFKLGGNSLKAITLTTILQNNFDIKITHVFNLRTPLRLAEQLHASKDLIKQKLELVKRAYKLRLDSGPRLRESGNDNLNCHPRESGDLQGLDSRLRENDIGGRGNDKSGMTKKPIRAVLLTGATGYLGCNLLNQLLKLTDYTIYLPVRANSKAEAIDRINKKFKFYFDEELDSRLRGNDGEGCGNDGEGCGNDKFSPFSSPLSLLSSPRRRGSSPSVFSDHAPRVIVFAADLEKNNLGLYLREYQELAHKIDSTIHAAALVKHNGEYDKFYSANVQATINLLEFTKLTKLKDFHYISTTGVLHLAHITKKEQPIYTENDVPEIAETFDNVYTQTKLQGEHQVLKYRDYGVNANIYRVGNLAFMVENCRAQENIDDNAFYNWLKCLFTIKCSSDAINTVEISSPDLTAQAIVKIFNKACLNNQIYHVFNPYLVNLTSFFKKNGLKTLSIDEFIGEIFHHLQNSNYYDLLVKFLFHQGWIDWKDIKAGFCNILQDKTQNILRQLEFNWLPITDEKVKNYFTLLNLIIEDKNHES